MRLALAISSSPIARAAVFLLVAFLLNFLFEAILPYNFIYFGASLLFALLLATVLIEGLRGSSSLRMSMLRIDAYSVKYIIYGLLISLSFFVPAFFLMLLFGANVAVNHVALPTLLQSFVVTAILSSAEELGFRGILLQSLSEKFGSVVAVFLLSLAFALLHIFNPNVSFIAIANVFLVGIAFSIMYLRTKSLWLPISFHTFWNYLQGYILGSNISGLPNINSLLSIKYDSRFAQFLGGYFGFEEGFLATFFIVVLIFMCLIYLKGNPTVLNFMSSRCYKELLPIHNPK